MSESELLIQQLLNGLTNGMIIALIALGYTMVFGIVELINFAHGDLVTLGGFLALTIIGVTAPTTETFFILLLVVPIFCGFLNIAIDTLVYAPVRGGTKLISLVSAIGVSFVLINIALIWGGLGLPGFGAANVGAAPKDFPSIIPLHNLFGESSNLIFTTRDAVIIGVTIPLLTFFSIFIYKTKMGAAMRAVAQDPGAASLMGINPKKIIRITFFIGGYLGGVASIMYSLYNGTISFQMGYRIGLDAFSAAVLGGIGNFQGAMLGGLLIGIIRALSDQYISTEWTSSVVFCCLIFALLFKPSGLLGSTVKEKV